MKYTLIVIILLSTISVSAQQWAVGGFINGGYSAGINTSFPELNYETNGKGSINHGLYISYQDNKYNFQLEFDRLNIGYKTRAEQGFSPSRAAPIPIRTPVYFITKLNYNYLRIGLKCYYKISPKLQVGIGLHPSKVSGNSIILQREIIMAGQKPTGDNFTIYGPYYETISNYENYNKYNLFTSLNFSYKIWRYISINTSYLISVFRFNSDADIIKQSHYHQGVLGGLTFHYPL